MTIKVDPDGHGLIDEQGSPVCEVTDCGGNGWAVLHFGPKMTGPRRVVCHKHLEAEDGPWFDAAGPGRVAATEPADTCGVCGQLLIPPMQPGTNFLPAGEYCANTEHREVMAARIFHDRAES